MAETMALPLNRIKKIRSLNEILTRSGQAVSAYREQRRGGNEIPSDEEFFGQMEVSQFGKTPIVSETLWQKFYNNGRDHFFPSCQDPKRSVEQFRSLFPGSAVNFVESADAILSGRIDLLGLSNLYVGTEIDWHLEPVSSKRSPLKHWKEFDELDSSETGNKKILWELNRHQHFFTLGVAYWLSGDERYAEAFAQHLETWMEQNPPGIGVNWVSSLEVAFRAMSWTWSFHFFEESDHFTPELFKQALKYLYQHGRHIERYLSKYYSPNTHLTGEGLGLYYLGTQFPFFDRARQWRALGEDILFTEVTKQILPDGVYFEQSTWYERYTVDFFTHFVILRSLADDAYYDDKAARFEERLQRAFDHLAFITRPDGTTPLIGDDDGGRMLPQTNAAPDDLRGTLALGSIIFDRCDHKFVSQGLSEEIFWLTGSQGVESYNALAATEPVQTSKDFAHGGYCVMRDGWDDTDNYLIVDHGEVGSLSGGHGHADALAIDVALHGKSLFVDSGTYTYHESRELRDHFRSTSAHNTLMVDDLPSSVPGSTFRWKTRASAERKTWITDNRFDLFEGSHDGYRRLKDPVTHTRSILFVKGDYWIMRDVAEANGEHEYSLNFHYHRNKRPLISEEGDFVGGDGHRMFTFGDNGAWHQKESWISNNHGNKINAPFLRFMSRGEGTQEFYTFILPVEHGVKPPDVTEVAMGTGRAFVIKYRGYTDLFVYSDVRGELNDTGVFASDFRYTWARLSEGESVPDEVVLIDGSRFAMADKEIINDSKTDFASIRRLGSDLYIRTSLGHTKRSLDQ